MRCTCQQVLLSTYVDVRVSKQVDRAPTEDMLLVSEARASNAVIGQASSCACMISPLLVLCTIEVCDTFRTHGYLKTDVDVVGFGGKNSSHKHQHLPVN